MVGFAGLCLILATILIEQRAHNAAARELLNAHNAATRELLKLMLTAQTQTCSDMGHHAHALLSAIEKHSVILSETNEKLKELPWLHR
jgi:hypothetical protein